MENMESPYNGNSTSTMCNLVEQASYQKRLLGQFSCSRLPLWGIPTYLDQAYKYILVGPSNEGGHEFTNLVDDVFGELWLVSFLHS